MSFISYAQNFEDVMLWRALKNIEKGFYIDVGANDPSIESVTKAFYERGWNGINIEPINSHFTDLQIERPRDINLHCAAGSSKGEIEIWECDIRGWASVDKLAIEKHTAMGKVGKYHKVPMATLAEICQQHAQHEIHFLKIDVEGFERSVLEGMDFGRFRPWIVVVEATRPNSTEEDYFEWEGLLVEANYLFAYADGLNRFYLALEHKYLAEALKYPPNVFDNFVRIDQFMAETNFQKAEAKVQVAEAVAHQAEVAVIAIQNSSSWRLTAPLRMVGRTVKSAFHLAKVTKRKKNKEKINLLLTHAKLYINRRPKLRRLIFSILARFPTLVGRIRQATGVDSSEQRAFSHIATESANLPPRARRIYADLIAARQNLGKEDF
ncbi:MAG: FkbM family methyltransferase [Methylococcales bacterium]|nr:FkbM family methyltransferase [Methylococcales bacterium]